MHFGVSVQFAFSIMKLLPFKDAKNLRLNVCAMCRSIKVSLAEPIAKHAAIGCNEFRIRSQHTTALVCRRKTKSFPFSFASFLRSFFSSTININKTPKKERCVVPMHKDAGWPWHSDEAENVFKTKNLKDGMPIFPIHNLIFSSFSSLRSCSVLFSSSFRASCGCEPIIVFYFELQDGKRNEFFRVSSCF